MLNNYYVSLVQSLNGYYVWFRAENEEVVRRHVSKYYGRLWCGTYTQEQYDAMRFNKLLVNNAPIILPDKDDPEYYRLPWRD